MPSPQYVNNLVVTLPIRRCSGVLMKVFVWKKCALNNQIFDVAKFIILTPLSLLS